KLRLPELCYASAHRRPCRKRNADSRRLGANFVEERVRSIVNSRDGFTVPDLQATSETTTNPGMLNQGAFTRTSNLTGDSMLAELLATETPSKKQTMHTSKAEQKMISDLVSTQREMSELKNSLRDAFDLHKELQASYQAQSGSMERVFSSLTALARENPE